MSSSAFAKKSTPNNKRRAPTASDADLTASNASPSQRNKRSLSERLRSLFRRDPSSKSRARSNDKRKPEPARSTTNSGIDSPTLRAPTVNWSIGKKKGTSSSSSKVNTQPIAPVEISNPIMTTTSNNRSDIQGENFVARSPYRTYDSIEILQPSAPNSIRVTTTPSRNQQVNLSDPDVFRPPSYISDRSRSPSMNYRIGSETDPSSPYYNERQAMSTTSLPISDVEVMPMAMRRVDGTTSYSTSEYVTTKPPTFPQSTASSRPSSTVPMTSNTLQRKTTSSSTLNNVEMRSTTSLAKEPDAPKLNAPTLSLGSTSSKKKQKAKKTKSGGNEMVTSTSTIANLVEQNPLNKKQSWANTYGSLPDAEAMYGGSTTYGSTATKPASNVKYPYISAIVAYHHRPEYGRYREVPQPPRGTYTTTSTDTNTNQQRPQRFDISTTTVHDEHQQQHWSQSKSPSTSNIHHDGHIRPLTPDRTSQGRDAGVIRVGLNISTAHPYGSESPTIYRSSTTIYTRDKTHHVEGGEIRTWNSPSHTDTTNTSGQKIPTGGTKPYVELEIIRKPDQVVPRPEPPRYTPPRERPKDKFVDEEEEQVHEERYEIAYQYERQIEEYSYQTRPLPDETYGSNQYTYASDGRKAYHDQDQAYYQNSQTYSSYAGNRQAIQESSNRNTPVHFADERIHTYRMRRSNDYDGLGIMVAADAKTRNHPFIREVEIGSPAYRAGLRANDRIISVNNVNVENMDFGDVLLLIQQALDNDNLQISVVHRLDSV